MAVDLPLCQALVQTNFPGRAPVMTRLINLKRESKLTLEQKGNQGRVKTLLWLQERNRGLKKKRKERQSICLWAPPPAVSSMLPPVSGAPGNRCREVGVRGGGSGRCFGGAGRRPCPCPLPNSAARILTTADPLCRPAPRTEPRYAPRAITAIQGRGRWFSNHVSIRGLFPAIPCCWPGPHLAYLLVHLNVQPVGHLVVLREESQHSLVRRCPEQLAHDQPGAQQPVPPHPVPPSQTPPLLLGVPAPPSP